MTIANESYTVTLTGKRLNNEEFSMEMVIAESGTPGETVRWFERLVRYDHTHATWDFYKEGTEVMLEAEWNTETKEGQVKDPVKIGDPNWHCWDTADKGLADKVCA